MPSGGFGAAGSSGGRGVSVFLFQRTRSSAGRSEEVRSRLEDGRLQLPQRRDVVEDPEPPPVRSRHEVVVLHHEVAHRRRRHVHPQGLPAVSPVERDPDLPFRSRVQQVPPLRVLAHGVHDPLVLRDPGRHVRPGLPAVARAVDVRPRVVEAEGVDRRPGRVAVEVRGLEQRDLGPRHELRRRHVLPALPAVARHVDEAVVGAGPDEPRVERRRGDGVDDAALRHGGGRGLPVLPHVRRHRPLLPRQVGADRPPSCWPPSVVFHSVLDAK